MCWGMQFNQGQSEDTQNQDHKPFWRPITETNEILEPRWLQTMIPATHGVYAWPDKHMPAMNLLKKELMEACVAGVACKLPLPKH